MKTIIYLNACGSISGAERSLLAILDALDRKHWRPVVAAPEGPLLEAVGQRGIARVPVPLSTLRRPHSLRDLLRIRRELTRGQTAVIRLLFELQPDILHANTTQAMLYTPRRCPPAIWHVRDLTPLGQWGGGMYRHAARVAVISLAVKKHLDSYANGDEKRVLIPPAVDTAHFHPAEDKQALRAQLGLPGDLPLIGLVAQFVPWKRHHLFLDALELLASEHWHAALAGADLHLDTGYLASINERLSTTPLAGRVTLLPWQPDPAMLFSALDICALTSENEPFGRAIIEAMACSTPAVAVDEGGPREIITPDTGLLTPPTPSGVANALATLLKNTKLRQKMGAAARAHIERAYSLGVQREALTAMYNSVLTTVR